MTEDFFTPRLSGPRFTEHTVPADVLGDLAALQEMLVELAKAAYMKEHPTRKRAPRNFDSEVQIHLANVGEGSATLKFVLFFSGLLTPYQSAFDSARTQVTQAVEAASRGHEPAMDTKYLSYFERIGRSLQDGESLGFPSGAGHAELNRETRRRLIQSSQVEEWTDQASLRARVSMTDYHSGKFEAELLDKSIICGKISPIIKEQLAEAHYQYGKGKSEWLLLQCVVLKDRSDKIRSIESVEHAALLDPLDVTLRLQELAELKDGWLDGQGRALPADSLAWLRQSFESHFDPELPLPRLYPTPKGDVLAEWLFGRRDISLDIDLASRRAELSVLDLDTEESRYESLELDAEQGWKHLNETLSAEKPAEEITS